MYSGTVFIETQCIFEMYCVLISAATQDYFEHLQLIKSVDDYAAYVDRFPKFLPSQNLHSERAAFHRYKASYYYYYKRV